MKRILAVLFVVLTAACATSRDSKPARVMPEVEFAELVGTQQAQVSGMFDVRYGVQITNPSPEPITLKRIEVRQVGSGAYHLVRNTPILFNDVIQPGETMQAAFWLHAYVDVMPGDTGSNEPVSLRVITYYNSPTGAFQKITQKLLGQF